MSTTTTKRTSTGRKKTEKGRIADEGARRVCFSKRRAGLFTKAAELAVLCGADIGVLVFSPSGRAYTLGHPSLEAAIARFLAGGSSNDQLQQAGAADMHQEVRSRCAELAARLDEEKGKMRMSAGPRWWEADVGSLGLEELQQFKKCVAELRRMVELKTPSLLPS